MWGRCGNASWSAIGAPVLVLMLLLLLLLTGLPAATWPAVGMHSLNAGHGHKLGLMRCCRVFQGLGYRGLCSLHHLLSIHSMRPPLFGVGREGEQAVLQCLRQMATSTVEVLASLQLRELTGATCLKECFAPLLVSRSRMFLPVCPLPL